FAWNFKSAGEYLIQVRLEPDALEADNICSLTLSVRDTIPVLLVNGKPAVERLEQATAWLAEALYPFPEGTNIAAHRGRPQVMTDAQFATMAFDDLAKYDCIFLCDVPRLCQRDVERLTTHLKRGGGLVIGLGPHVDAEAYNRLLYRDGDGILPAKLVGA